MPSGARVVELWWWNCGGGGVVVFVIDRCGGCGVSVEGVVEEWWLCYSPANRSDDRSTWFFFSF